MSSDPHQHLVVQLTAQLDAELALHRRLLASTEATIAAVVAGDHAAISSHTAAEQTGLAESARLRHARERLLRAISGVFDLKTPTISGLIAKLPTTLTKLGDELRYRSRDLVQILDRLKRAHEHLTLLSRHCLGLVQNILDAITGAPRAAQTPYDRRGAYATATAQRGQLVNLRG